MNNEEINIPTPLIIFMVFVAALFFCAVISINTPYWGYWNHRVNSNEVGVELVRGQFTRVLPPGVHTNLTLFADITDVNVSAIEFAATDPEVLTADQQRIGLVVAGTVTRPGLANDTMLTVSNWQQYQSLYINNDMLVSRVSALAQQAMKVCVGDRTFKEAAIGATRNDLRICIQDEIRSYAEPYHLTINNVIVPEIIISEQVQTQLDQITAALNERLLAEANAGLVAAQAETDLAQAQGEIRVQQGIVQETERQQAVTADLERQRLEAEQAVINAQAANDMAVAQYQVQLAELALAKAILEADSQLAVETALATLMTANIEYSDYRVVLAKAAAISNVDFAYVPVGTDLLFMFDESGTVAPIVDVSP